MKRTLIICDIDGVLADCSHRLHYLNEKDYDSFYSERSMLDDKLIQPGASLLYHLWNYRYDSNSQRLRYNPIVFLTGRPCRTRSTTRSWIEGNLMALMSQFPLIMRSDGDHRPSPIVKTELLKLIIDNHGNRMDTIYFIDDDPENVKAACKAFPKITGITFGIGRMR